jgi:hypothetical protein
MSIPRDSSSKKKRVHLLADEELRRFILDFVNLQADSTQFVWKLAKRYPKILPLPKTRPEDVEAVNELLNKLAKDVEALLPGRTCVDELLDRVGSGVFDPEEAKEWLEQAFWYRQECLRRAWRWPAGTYERLGAMAELLFVSWGICKSSKANPYHSPLRADRCLFNVFLAMRLADQDQDKMAICQNPECCTPYYFLCKKGQRFCSEKCAGVGNREAKRRWWTKHGKKWRTGRTKQLKAKGRKA